jgi:pimeloyl-ACP methyl ester carboxylesterase
LLALTFPERVRSLVLISTSGATPGDRDLPPPTDSLRRFLSTAEVDWSDEDSVIGYITDFCRMLSGGRHGFDEAQMRDLVRHDVKRARDFAARRNHDLLAPGDQPSGTVSSITVPTLVIHGTADPMFPVEHGEALADDIPAARLMRLEGRGHGIDPADQETIAAAIIDHLNAGRTRSRAGREGQA